MSEALPAWLSPVWSWLAPALTADRLGHALLFVGPPGVGKRRLADTLARALLCQSPGADGLPCGECRACAQMAAGSHPDYAELTPEEGARDIRVAQTRAFGRKLSLTAHYHRRVGLIDPAEAFTAGAANSLLKTLEEPPAGAHILLVSERPSAVLATIRSRCQRIRVPLPAPAEAEAWAAGRDPAVAAALPLARGAPLRAEALAEAGAGERHAQWWDDLEALLGGRASPPEVAERWNAGPHAELLDWLYLTAGDVLKRAAGVPPEAWVQRDHAQRLENVAESIDVSRLRRTVNVIVETRRLLSTNVDRQLMWEALAIELWVSRQRGGSKR